MGVCLWVCAGCVSDPRVSEGQPERPDAHPASGVDAAHRPSPPDGGLDALPDTASPDTASPDAALPDAAPRPDASSPPDATPDAMVEVEPCACLEAPEVTCQRPACVDGACVYIERVDGTPCDDLDPETVGDRCVSGECVGVPELPGVLGRAGGYQEGWSEAETLVRRITVEPSGALSLSAPRMVPPGDWAAMGGGLLGVRGVSSSPQRLMSRLDGGTLEATHDFIPPQLSLGEPRILEGGAWWLGSGPWARLDPSVGRLTLFPTGWQAVDGPMISDGARVAWFDPEGGVRVASALGDPEGVRVADWGLPHDQSRLALVGDRLAYTAAEGGTYALVVVDLSGQRAPFMVREAGIRRGGVRISEDGQWLARLDPEETWLLYLGGAWPPADVQYTEPRWRLAEFLPDGSAALAVGSAGDIIRVDLVDGVVGYRRGLAQRGNRRFTEILHVSMAHEALWVKRSDGRVIRAPLDTFEPDFPPVVPEAQTLEEGYWLCGVDEAGEALWFVAYVPEASDERYKVVRVPMDATQPPEEIEVPGRRPLAADDFCLPVEGGLYLGKRGSVEAAHRLVAHEAGEMVGVSDEPIELVEVPGFHGAYSPYGPTDRARGGVLTDGEHVVLEALDGGWRHLTWSTGEVRPLAIQGAGYLPTPLEFLPDHSGVLSLAAGRVAAIPFDGEPVEGPLHQCEEVGCEPVFSPSGWRVAWGTIIYRQAAIMVMDLRDGQIWRFDAPDYDVLDVPLGFVDESSLVFDRKARWPRGPEQLHLHWVSLEGEEPPGPLGEPIEGAHFQAWAQGVVLYMAPGEGELKTLYGYTVGDGEHMALVEGFEGRRWQGRWVEPTPSGGLLIGERERAVDEETAIIAQEILWSFDGGAPATIELPPDTRATPFFSNIGEGGEGLFAVAGATELDIYQINPDGPPTRLTSADGRTMWPVGRSHDGRWLAVEGPVGLGFGVYVLDLHAPGAAPIPALWSDEGDVRFEGFQQR